MDVRAVNRKGNKIKLTPGNAKYPSEEKFEKIGKGELNQRNDETYHSNASRVPENPRKSLAHNLQ